MVFKEAQRKVVEVYGEMKKRYPEVKWGPEEFMIDLVEEIGELANALLVEQGHKFKSRKKSDLDDAFFDVLFDLLMLAFTMKVDLDQAFERGLEEFRLRIQKGEFDEQS
ncbi:MAG: hypothetical protein N2440_02130 [Actinobacteria bacterium]|nr:hypothetical protein [Actinomycetota bacterium]